MFTKNLIKVSELSATKDLEVLKDGSFSYITKIESDLSDRLVPCSQEKHINSCNSDQTVNGLIVKKGLVDLVNKNKFIIISEKPLETAFKIHEEISNIKDFQWKDFPTQIDSSSSISENAIIAQNNVLIGKNVRISRNAVIHQRTIIEDNCVIGAGTVLSCDAFQVFNINEKHQKIIKQSGGVRLKNNVEIQSNCTVSRAVFGGFTEIGSETLIDSQVHVGHDCKIGKKVLIANQASLAGRVLIEDGAYIAPNATISNGLKIGKNAKITIGSTVISDVPENTTFTGYGAVDHKEWMRQRIMQMRKK